MGNFTKFRKSTFSFEDTSCVEIALAGQEATTAAAVRDTKARSAGTLQFNDASNWKTFLRSVAS